MPRPGFSFSHFGMYVNDIAKVEDFYTRILDFTVTDRGQLPGPNGTPMDLVFLSRDPDEHHQIVLITGRPEALAFNPINQISLKADSLQTLCAMYRTLLAEGMAIVPVTHGNAVSIYVPDPEGNRLELYFDLPWYVSQPMRVSIDLADEATLMQRLEAHARSLPGFKPRSEWRAEMARRMGVEQGAKH